MRAGVHASLRTGVCAAGPAGEEAYCAGAAGDACTAGLLGEDRRAIAAATTPSIFAASDGDAAALDWNKKMTL